MRDDDEEADLGLRDWAVPPPPADLVDRIMTAVEDSGAPRIGPVDPPATGRRVSVAAVVAAALLGAGAAAAAVVAVYESRDAAPTSGATSGAPGEVAGEPAPGPRPAERRPTYSIPKDGPAPPSEPRRLTSPAERRQVWGRLVAARALREAGVTAPPAAAGGAAPADVDPAEIQASVREVAPLLGECFELASERVQAQGGTVKVKLVVGSEPEVGTLIEEVSFLDGDPDMLADPDFTECLTETLMSVQMPPLDAGGQLVIHYPFTFSMDEPEL